MQGLECRVQGSEFRVLGFRVRGLGFWVKGFRGTVICSFGLESFPWPG